MRILLTGATGVLGRRVLPALVAQGHDVSAIGRTAEKRKALAKQGARPIDLNLFDANAVMRAVKGHDAIINLATHIPQSNLKLLLPGGWRENDRLRRDASTILADAAIRLGVERFVQESYAPVYPDMGEKWVTEVTPLSPLGFNRTILDAEAAAERVRKTGAAAVTLRFGHFYGADARQTTEMIPYVRRGFAPLPGSADAFMSSVSHDDAAAAVVAALKLPSDVYNVVDDIPVTHRDFVDSLADALGVAHPKLPPRWITMLFGPVGALVARSVRISNRKLRDTGS